MWVLVYLLSGVTICLVYSLSSSRDLAVGEEKCARRSASLAMVVNGASKRFARSVHAYGRAIDRTPLYGKAHTVEHRRFVCFLWSIMSQKKKKSYVSLISD